MNWHLKDDPTRGIIGGKGWTGYSWDRRLFPYPADLLGALAARGVACGANLHDHHGVGPYEERYGEMAAAVGLPPPADDDGGRLNATTIRFNISDKTSTCARAWSVVVWQWRSSFCVSLFVSPTRFRCGVVHWKKRREMMVPSPQVRARRHHARRHRGRRDGVLVDGLRAQGDTTVPS